MWILVFLLPWTWADRSSLPTDVQAYYASIDHSKDLKDTLFTILNSYHKPHGNADIILPSCSDTQCYKHTPLTYKSAREYLFGYLHLSGNAQTGYHLETYYCGELLSIDDFNGQKDAIGPMKIPSEKIANVEHAWPQSLFTNKFPKGTQKADLHILYPEISKVNAIRGNFPYGDVTKPKTVACQDAALGLSKENDQVFEPHTSVKGDMARATFYYVTRYQAKLSKNEEAYLREWHKLDPVDQHEIERNNKVFEIEKVRNPFIDMPELVDQIQDF
ncbi:MAG: endonuclease [Bdellovibrionaceae bacterium]|nr:endonuclease [Pseudobdellovibrionaceae bacterium]